MLSRRVVAVVVVEEKKADEGGGAGDEVLASLVHSLHSFQAQILAPCSVSEPYCPKWCSLRHPQRLRVSTGHAKTLH